MTLKVGDKLPDAAFMHMGPDGPDVLSGEKLFSGRRVVLFALPGAFTPTCSAEHLPGFVKLSEAIKAKGVDDIACLSVNDVFVMDAWGREQNVGNKLLMLADGNCDFTRAVGLDMDGRGFGMGPRSQRYAMLVTDGVVEKLFVDEAGEFEISSAAHMLENL